MTDQWQPVTPLIDDQPAPGYWRPFAVGDRVRYRYQPECPGVYGMAAPVGHPLEYDRMEGHVYEVLRGGRNPHQYMVRLVVGGAPRSICAAVTELEAA